MNIDRLALILGLLLIAFMVTGCLGLSGAPVRLVVDDEKFYSRNIKFEINKLKCEGTCVVPRAPKYDIRLWAKSDLDFMVIESCSRKIPVERHDNDFSYTFLPIPGLEDTDGCALSFDAVEKDHNRRALGWVDFQHPRRTLPAVVKCNDRVVSSPGVSACESGRSKKARIEFDKEVVVGVAKTTQDHCDVFKSSDQKAWDFVLPRGQCTVIFQEKIGGRSHLLSTYGSDETLPMEAMK
jgi:hypothetical protein